MKVGIKAPPKEARAVVANMQAFTGIQPMVADGYNVMVKHFMVLVLIDTNKTNIQKSVINYTGAKM